MAKKKSEVSDGLPSADTPVPGSPCVVVELVDAARAAVVAECEAYLVRNESNPTDGFRAKVFTSWFDNHAVAIREAFQKDVLG